MIAAHLRRCKGGVGRGLRYGGGGLRVLTLGVESKPQQAAPWSRAMAPVSRELARAATLAH